MVRPTRRGCSVGVWNQFSMAFRVIRSSRSDPKAGRSCLVSVWSRPLMVEGLHFEDHALRQTSITKVR